MRALAGSRETPKLYIIKVLDVMRPLVLQWGQALTAAGDLAAAGDIFYVTLDDLQRKARGEAVDLKGSAARNRAEYEREAGRRQMPRLLLSTGEAFYEGVEDEAAGPDVLAGEAVSAGVAEGLVRVVLDPSGTRLEPGEILVCPATNPGWTPLFLAAGGLVMEIGGLVTHGSVVAREYGIPAVVGVQDATTRLKTGQRVRVDGNTGRVTVISNH
jgi:pyruvate,water dikinase